VINGVKSNYETDLFMPIIEATQRLTGHSDSERDADIVPYRVIADHIRAAVFLIADGVMPGAKGRDSVCRLVIRRASRFGAKLGFNEPFLSQLVDTVLTIMGEHYTELVERAPVIKRVITQEEERFRRTLDRGMNELEAEIERLRASGQTQLEGKTAFYLKASLGLPIQVTQDILAEHGMTVDMQGFVEAEDEHALRSGGGQAMGKIASAAEYSKLLENLKTEGLLGASGVEYLPYGDTKLNAKMVAILVNGERTENAIVGDKVEVVLDKTPFYVEAGGQVSDTGRLFRDGWQIDIEDMRRPVAGLIVHVGEVVEGNPETGSAATAEIDAERRADIIRNHTATHLLHAALRNQLGSHVQQRGSLVAPDRLRFDFAHDARVTTEQLRTLENEVNNVILRNLRVQAQEKPLNEARAEGAMALFGEKYGETVRTISIANNGDRYSYELCGGVHVSETAQIGAFALISEGSVSAGIRRVEAVTGRGAVEYLQRAVSTLNHAAAQLMTTPDELEYRIAHLQGELAQTRKQVEALRKEAARGRFTSLLAQVESVNGKQALIARLDDVPADTLRDMADWFREAVRSGVLVIGGVIDGKPQLLIAVTDDQVKQGLHAGDLIKQVAPIIGGGGGGRPNMAQAGGKDPSKIDEALQSARQLLSAD
jgi:alanyl-tRNA synthetase